MFVRVNESTGGWTTHAVGDIIKVKEHPSNENLYRLVSPGHYFNFVDDDIIWLNLPKHSCEEVNREDTILKTITWEKLKVDTPLLELNNGKWEVVYFAIYRNNIPYIFEKRKTSLTANYIKKIFNQDYVVLLEGN